ncbi:hypothetical protein [Yersinia rohdei]|uniref:hypothetical protein n=1 Tax=Yersinia rohdei TaxID=29485 RepID=UPI0021BD64E1|nr:hypothetical protein [Yersinia rohdei]MDN0095399.1 hypothetical protein [Yersinia rohdei]
MKYKFLLYFLFLISGLGMCSTKNEYPISNKSLNDYKTYLIARCITNNYIKMGVNFDKLHLKDYTMGFIDIEDGFAFSVRKDNALDVFIKNKTDDFYQPKQTEGDLATVNLVIYDCIVFSQSKEADVFLKELIFKETSDN